MFDDETDTEKKFYYDFYIPETFADLLKPVKKEGEEDENINDNTNRH